MGPSPERRGGWPPNTIPIELFVKIAGLVDSRQDLNALCLVNKEFNAKLGCCLFQRLVIHVGPGLCAKVDAGLPYRTGLNSVDVTDYLSDTNIFRNFGSDIRRFGLALELDERDLASPSTGDMEAVEISHWGVYRWPDPSCDSRARSHLACITKSLERSQGVFRLLSGVRQIQELALSCEGGLGYLQGPDINRLLPPTRFTIFGDPNLALATEDDSYQIEFDKSYRHEMVERKLAVAGVDPTLIPGLIDQLVANERTTLEGFSRERRRRPLLPGGVDGRNCRVTARPQRYYEIYRLQPDLLTDTQKRFLYQHVTAQAALVQSFLLAAIDNSTHFENLTKINIARLSSFHIDSLCRDDFWSCLRVEEVSLAVVPDWRALTQINAFTIGDREVFPTDAMPKVFRLLNDYIGKQPHVKKLHFEWICGGELAPGHCQRNQNILPAPFLKEHRKVVNSSLENLLILPFVSHLSLKNCWFAPNVFYRIVQTMSQEHHLVSLELETVSLSGPSIFRARMLDVDIGSNDQHLGDNDNTPALNPLMALYVAARMAPDPEPNELRRPLDLSWCHIIDMLTPGPTIVEQLQGENREDHVSLPITKRLKLQKLVFKSCGYVMVPDDRFISDRRFRHITSPRRPPEVMLEAILQARMAMRNMAEKEAISGIMQKSTDRHLAKIVTRLDRDELFAMRRVFGFHIGWDGIYDANFIRAAWRDDVPNPGAGRFSGTIQYRPDSTRYAFGDDDTGGAVYEYNNSVFDENYDDNADIDNVMNRMMHDLGYTEGLGRGRPQADQEGSLLFESDTEEPYLNGER
ncbi:hypothetical protein GGS23DRAFT_163601 [Durotheca rogersii]|uniref:uncharacterized protein n=1 Tax=Durotheca rogersii TaxID=419775 RepID=UPI0022205161|nr:uncharacterized protein GGS23DRAFT_163601 [Durotheca rogersii]KAI5867154.1 hypothetical protein GGS23DRAFT_163601 [Durotheca rogersii]